MKRHALAFLLAAAFTLQTHSQKANELADADEKKNAPKKELTREEIAKLEGFEANPDSPVAFNLQFEVLMVAMPDAVAVPLVESLRDPAKIDEGCKKLMTLLESKKARVTGWPRIQTKSGNRAVAENIQEVRYATEFDNPPVAGAAPAPPKPKAPPGPAVPPAQGVRPTTFETRNAGATLELEPQIGPDDKTIDVQFCAQHVRLLGWESITVQENGQTKVSIPQPRFQTNKVTQNLSIQSGQKMLIGTFRLEDSKEMELFILGAARVPVKVKAAGPKK